MSTEIATRGDSLPAQVEREVGARLKQLTTLLGGEPAAKRFARALVVACEQTNRHGELLLGKCSTSSIVQAALGAAQIGLEVGGPRSHAALVPYGREAKLIIMVAGWLRVAKREGAILDAQVVLVREGESFHWDPTADQPVRHSPAYGLTEPGEVIAAYVILTLPGGQRIVDVVPGYYLARVEKFALTKAGDRQTPWRGEWREEMLKKTALRKAIGRHLDPVLSRTVETLDASSALEPVLNIAEIVEDAGPELATAKPKRAPARAVIEAETPTKTSVDARPVRERIYALLETDGLSRADADSEIAQRWPAGPTDAELEAWLAGGCR